MGRLLYRDMKKQLIEEVDKILVDNALIILMDKIKRKYVSKSIVDHVVLRMDKLRFEKKPL